MSKKQADILFILLALALLVTFFGTFLGFSDWLESKGVPKLLAFWGPLLTGLFGGVILNHYRANWFDDE